MIYEKEKCESIYRQVLYYDRQLAAYRRDALQEIACAVLASENDREAFRMSQKLCRRMLRNFGWRPPEVRERFEMHLRVQYSMGGGI